MPEARHLAIAAMRNEGPFVIEWVCWYRMLGFTDILVLTNDCTDGTDLLLDALMDAGWVTHVRHAPAPGEPPKRSAHRVARAHPLTAAADWVMICDVDEFLVVHLGDGSIGALVGGDAVDFAGMAVHWKCFGSGGRTRWEDGLVHLQYTRAAPSQHPANTSFKSIFRDPLRYPQFGAHGPKGRVAGWGGKDDRWIDGSGRDLSRWHPETNPQKATAADRITHANAQINHYAVRTPEEFALKRGTPSSTAFADRYTDAFYRKHDRNEETDLSALRYADRFDPLHTEAMRLPGVAALHARACAARADRIAAGPSRAGTQGA